MPSKDFRCRQEEHLIRKGQSNATSTSRQAEDFSLQDEDDEDYNNDNDETKSSSGRSNFSIASHTPSLHPSMQGSTFSMACSESTIGAGDNTLYWDYKHRLSKRSDLGHSCRECRLKFSRLNEPMTERRGARCSFRYHAECFSGFADPRSQVAGSMHVGNLRNTQLDAAPQQKAGSKMRASKQFDSGSDRRVGGGGGGGGGGGMGGGGMGGKIGAFLGGGNGFGTESSRGVSVAAAAGGGAAENGGLSQADLEAHTKIMGSAVDDEKVMGGLRGLRIVDEEDGSAHSK